MRGFFKLIIFGVSIIVYFFANSPISFAELIEPTQTLEGEKQPTTGRLTILSEQPGQKITLDGKLLGKTPTFLVEIEAGVHTLRVTDSEMDIYVEPRKTVKISLHKNEFILIPDKEIQVEPEAEIEVRTQTPEASTEQSRDPLRQRVDKNRRRSQQRWQQFLDGTKPTF